MSEVETMKGTEYYRRRIGDYSLVAYVTPCDDLDLSWDDTGEVLDRLNRGVYVAFDVEVVATHIPTGVAGSDYLSSNIYEHPGDFFTETGGYFICMRRNALVELRAKIQKLREGLPVLRGEVKT